MLSNCPLHSVAESGVLVNHIPQHLMGNGKLKWSLLLNFNELKVALFAIK